MKKQEDMKKIIDLLKIGFESSCYKTPEFKSFARKFKNVMAKELAAIGAKITAYNTGHFYVSGFFRTPCGNCYYFNLGDVRGSEVRMPSMMYRHAENEKDYTGGTNMWIGLEDGIGKKMSVL